MKIVSILNQKGGSGKTTLTTNLAFALSLQKQKVLIVDSDPQGSASDWGNETGGEIVPVVGLNRPKNLPKDIEAVSSGYDYVLIDGAPQLSDQMSSAIRVSDIVLIPVQPSPYDIWAAASLVDAIKQRQELGSELKAFFVISRAITNTNLAGEVKGALSEYGLPSFTSSTTQKISYSSSAAAGKTVFQTNDKKAQSEVESIAKELMELK